MDSVINNPGKIGIGAVASYGLERMLSDLGDINAGWFYTWEPDISAWMMGSGASLEGPLNDRHLAMDSASGGWSLQNARLSPGAVYDLSLSASGGRNATGGVVVTFRDQAGKQSLDKVVLFDGDDGEVSLSGLATPSWATRAQILTWSDVGVLEIDDLSLSARAVEAVRNGGFENGVRASVSGWSMNDGAAVSGVPSDRALRLEGAKDGWAYQDAKAVGGQRYDLSFEVSDAVRAAGGVIVTFSDSAGKGMRSAWVPVGSQEGPLSISDILAPTGAVKARVTAWADEGSFEIDDVSLSQRTANLMKNGDVQSGTSSATGWTTSKGVAIGGTSANRSMVLDGSKNGWAYQDISVKGRQVYDFSMRADAPVTTAGGVMVTFSDSAGKKLGDTWAPLDGKTGEVSLRGILAPDGAVKARVLAWSDAVKIEVDDFRLATRSPNILLNGGMEAGTIASAGGWDFGDSTFIGGTGTDRYLVIGGDEGWAAQKTIASEGTYDLSFDLGNLHGAQGGISVRFVDASGRVIADDWAPFGGSGETGITGMRAPSGTVGANILAWTDSGTVTLDDISLTSRGGDAVIDGDFEGGTPFAGHPALAGHVPMIWGRDDVNPRDLAALRGEPVILGFNEPDERTQSNMSVAEAIALWPELMATGARLGSPATTTSGTLGANSWLGKFMAQAEAADLRVDFVAVHYYSTNKSVAAFETFLHKVHEAYGKPVWVTEWALADWANPGRFSAAENEAFFREAVRMMDDLPFVEKHAWFGLYDGMGGWDINTGLIGSGGDPTIIGDAFGDLTDAFVFGSAGFFNNSEAAGDDLAGMSRYASLEPEDRVGTDLSALFGMDPPSALLEYA